MLCLHKVLWSQNSNELYRKLCPRIIPVWFLQSKWILIWIILRFSLQNSRHQLFKFRCYTLYTWTQDDSELLITLLHTLTANVTFGTVRGREWDPDIWFFSPVTQKSFLWLWFVRSCSFAVLLGFETGSPTAMDEDSNLVSHQSTLQSQQAFLRTPRSVFPLTKALQLGFAH